MRRPAIGIIALLLLVAGAVLWIWPTGDGYQLYLGACVRVGAVMAVFWLAYEEVSRLPAWIWATVPVLLVILAVRPKWLLIAVPIVLVMAILKPRSRAPR